MHKSFRVAAAAFFMAAVFPFHGAAKSIQPEADYYEDGNHAPMCMMCHMVVQPASNVTLNLGANKTSLLPGEQAAITVTRSNFGANWKPGIVLQMAHGDKFAQRAPKDYGWQLTNPKSNPFNYSVWENPPTPSLTWIFKAPKMPGSYTIATSAYFNDGGASLDTLGKPGTKRGNNTLTITVGKVAETQKPQFTAVVALYKIYVILKFSEPMDPATALTASNYQVKNAANQAVAVSQVFQSRDETVVYLKTAALDPLADYAVAVQNLKDYASVANTIDPATRTFRPDGVTPYNFTCMLAQDLTQTAFMWYDHFETLGNDTAKAMNRINLSFIITPSTSDVLDKPVDMLADIPFDTAKLVYRVSASTALTSSPSQWDLYRLMPSGAMDPNLPISNHWSGFNQAGSPIASLGKQVTLVQNGVPQTWWEWDITSVFRTEYAAKTRGLEFRLKARTENTSTGGVAFYGHDHDTATFRPHIALTFRQTGTAAEALVFRDGGAALQITPNPIANTGRISLAGSWDGGMQEVSFHDLSGKRVHRMVAPGLWDARGVPSGVYIATARGAGGVVRQKITVLR